jgi:hypothetical protein
MNSHVENWEAANPTSAFHGLAEIKGVVLLRSLHGDPRWRALLGKMGFEG